MDQATVYLLWIVAEARRTFFSAVRETDPLCFDTFMALFLTRQVYVPTNAESKPTPLMVGLCFEQDYGTINLQ